MSACVILLIDESEAMQVPVARGADAPAGLSVASSPKSKAESVASAVNSLLNRLTAFADCELALVGYRTASDNQPDVGCRWSGSLSGREFVFAGELPATVLRTEQRTRKVPAPGGLWEEQSFLFPVWYEPRLGPKSPQIKAFEFCRCLIANWSSSQAATAPPLVVNISGGPSGDGNPHRVVQEILGMALPGGTPLVLQAHLASDTPKGALEPTVFPANRAYVTQGPMRDLYDRTSVLPAEFVAVLREAKLPVNEKSRGLVCNARMLDVSRLLSLAYEHAKRHHVPGSAVPASIPPPAPATPGPQPPVEPAAIDSAPAETASVVEPLAVEPAPVEEPPSPAPLPPTPRVTPDSPALVVFVLDRSVTDPYSQDTNNVCNRLADQLAEMLGKVEKLGSGAIETAVFTYGLDAAGELDLRCTLEGGLAGRSFVRDHELAAGALRLEEFVEEKSNGAGGIMTIPHRRLYLVQIEPSLAASPIQPLARVAEAIAEWCRAHPTSSLPPIVLHLTRGAVSGEEMRQALGPLTALSAPSGGPAVYHLVLTEAEQPTLAYPSSSESLADSNLRTLWELSSLLLGRERLAEQTPTVDLASRGFVVNGEFNFLLNAVRFAMPEA